MSFGPLELFLILLLVLILFGAKKLRNLGGDLGTSVKNFKSAVKEDNPAISDKKEKNQEDNIPFSESETLKVEREDVLDNRTVFSEQETIIVKASAVLDEDTPLSERETLVMDASEILEKPPKKHR